jgi:hypothetical protein
MRSWLSYHKEAVFHSLSTVLIWSLSGFKVVHNQYQCLANYHYIHSIQYINLSHMSHVSVPASYTLHCCYIVKTSIQ